jgi:hypothetical protein
MALARGPAALAIAALAADVLAAPTSGVPGAMAFLRAADATSTFTVPLALFRPLAESGLPAAPSGASPRVGVAKNPWMTLLASKYSPTILPEALMRRHGLSRPASEPALDQGLVPRPAPPPTHNTGRFRVISR